MWPALAGIGGSLISGLFGASGQKKEEAFQREQFDYQKQLNDANNVRQDAQRSQDWLNDLQMVGINQQYNTRERLAAQQYATQAADTAYQRQMAADNSRVQRLVQDAKSAGIHPLAALGAQLSAPIIGAASGGAGSGAMGSRGSSSSGAVSQFSPLAFQPQNPWGDAIGNALKFLSDAKSSVLDDEVKKAQIRNLDAESAATLSSARSRTLISSARGAVRGGPGSHVNPSTYKLAGGVPVDATPGRSTYGELASRYGMLISEVAGWFLGAEDAARTYAKRGAAPPSQRSKNISKMESLLGPSPNWDFGQWFK